MHFTTLLVIASSIATIAAAPAEVNSNVLAVRTAKSPGKVYTWVDMVADLNHMKKDMPKNAAQPFKDAISKAIQLAENNESINDGKGLSEEKETSKGSGKKTTEGHGTKKPEA